MIFVPLDLEGAFLLRPEPHEDERGSFTRTWCEAEASAHGLALGTVQCNVSRNIKKGTLRGLHFQRPPHEERKLVRCTRGSMMDVIVDLRKGSPTYLAWRAAELSADNGLELYIPEGFAHGFQTLEDHTEVFYQMSAHYRPEAAGGWRWDDPAFGIRWPLPNPVLSRRDASFPDYV